MPRLVGFGWFAALLEEQISEEIGRRILSCDNGGGPVEHWPVVHVEPHSQADRLDAQRQLFRLGITIAIADTVRTPALFKIAG